MDHTLHQTLTDWRRHLHANPELTLHETETAAFVRAKLQDRKSTRLNSSHQI